MCTAERTLACELVGRKVNACADNGDDVLKSDLTSVQKFKLHDITDLISLMEQAPQRLFTAGLLAIQRHAHTVTHLSLDANTCAC